MFRAPFAVVALAAALSAASCLPEDGKYACTADTDCVDGFSCFRGVCVKDAELPTDPCELAACHADATCTVNAGVGQCACKPGFDGDGKTCTASSDPCASAGCSADATCAIVDGAAKCTCKDGYTGDGKACAILDCTVDNGGCHADATCSGDPGAVTCACKDGFDGDGKTCTCRFATKGACAGLPVTSGLAAHYSARVAASVTKDGNGKVSAWNDLSGKDRHLTTDDGPTWKADGLATLPGLDFADGKRMASAAFPLTRQVTVFMVVRQGTPADGGGYAQHGDVKKDWAISYNASEAAVGFRTNDEVTSTDTPLVSGSEYVLVARLGTLRNFASITGGSTVSVNGTGSTTITEGSKVLYVGANEFSEGSNATIGELVYYDRALTNGERGAVMAWLGAAWGIRACADGQQDNDLDGNCKADCATAGVTGCDANAACSDATGTATCTCAAGYAGDGTTCRACDPCSANGRCDDGPSGSGECLCNTGYDGDDCTACADSYEMVGGVCRTGRTVVVPGTNNQNIMGLVGDRTGFAITGNANGNVSNFYGGLVEHSWGYDTAFLIGHDASGRRTFATKINPNQRFHPTHLARGADGGLLMSGWAYASEVLVSKIRDVTGASSTQVIDGFDFGAHTLTGNGNPSYSGYSGAGPVGFARELYVRDGHSGTGVSLTVDTAEGGVEFWGTAGAPEQRIMYGSTIGMSHASFGDPSPNRGNQLSLSRTLDDVFEVEVARIPGGVSLQVTLETSGGRFETAVGPLVVGTNRLPLASFPGLTADAARSIFGLRIGAGVNATRGNGLLITELRFGAAEPAQKVTRTNGGFFFKFDKDGNYKWHKNFGLEAYGSVEDIVGNVAVVGYTGGSADFGNGPVNGGGGADAVLVSYTADGTFRWGKVLGGSAAGHAVPGDTFSAVATDGEGNLYVTGSTAQTATFGGDTFTCPYNGCLLVASFDSDGNHRWSKVYPTTRADGFSAGQNITVNGTTVVVSGHFRGAHDFGDGVVDTPPAAENPQATAIVLLALGTTSGNFLAKRAFTTGYNMQVRGLTWDINNDLHVVGWFDSAGGDIGAAAPLAKGGLFRAVYSNRFVHKSSQQPASQAGATNAKFIIPFPDGTELAAGETNNSVNWGYGVAQNTSRDNDLWFTWFP